MKKKLLGVVVAVFLAISGIAFAGDQDFTLVNDTGADITGIYISAASVDNWEENLMDGDEILPAGNEIEVSFSPEEDAELWDIKVTDEEGTALFWERLKLTEISKVVLKITNGKPVAEVK